MNKKQRGLHRLCHSGRSLYSSPYFEDIQTFLTDTIWTLFWSQEWVCLFVSICLTLVERTTRLYGTFLFCGGQLLRHVFCVLRSLAPLLFLGSWILSSILLIHPQVSKRGECVCVCVCVCVCLHAGVRGAPWGEAGQSLPPAALGQGMAIQDTCLGSQPNLTVASPHSVSYTSYIYAFTFTLKYTHLP